MALSRLPSSNLNKLVRGYLSSSEYSGTRKTIRELSKGKKRGYLTKEELMKVCIWKSPRAIRHIRRNHESTVRRITRAVFETRDEKTRLDLLLSLRGVGVPMASSLLMLTNPKRYGVIDIRVWQVLHKLRAVNGNKAGVGFRFREWNQFLCVLRALAKRYHVKARDVERALFDIHTDYQKGLLYKYSP